MRKLSFSFGLVLKSLLMRLNLRVNGSAIVLMAVAQVDEARREMKSKFSNNFPLNGKSISSWIVGGWSEKEKWENRSKSTHDGTTELIAFIMTMLFVWLLVFRAVLGEPLKSFSQDVEIKVRKDFFHQFLKWFFVFSKLDFIFKVLTSHFVSRCRWWVDQTSFHGGTSKFQLNLQSINLTQHDTSSQSAELENSTQPIPPSSPFNLCHVTFDKYH